jgi:hypothetical protein
MGRVEVGAAARGGPRRQAEAGAELEHAPTADIERRDMVGEGNAARPQLGPVRQELLDLERLLVDQLLGARRPQEGQRPACDDELLFDQSAAKRSTGTPSGSRSCAYR